jgi:hypothetical protein
VVAAPPSAGAVVAPAAAESVVVVVEAESVVVAGAEASVEVDSVVVVVSAGFDSHEVRTAANAKARVDTFRIFFILMLGLKTFCLENVLHTGI